MHALRERSPYRSPGRRADAFAPLARARRWLAQTASALAQLASVHRKPAQTAVHAPTAGRLIVVRNMLQHKRPMGPHQNNRRHSSNHGRATAVQIEDETCEQICVPHDRSTTCAPCGEQAYHELAHASKHRLRHVFSRRQGQEVSALHSEFCMSGVGKSTPTSASWKIQPRGSPVTIHGCYIEATPSHVDITTPIGAARLLATWLFAEDFVHHLLRGLHGCRFRLLLDDVLVIAPLEGRPFLDDIGIRENWDVAKLLHMRR